MCRYNNIIVICARLWRTASFIVWRDIFEWVLLLYNIILYTQYSSFVVDRDPTRRLYDQVAVVEVHYYVLRFFHFPFGGDQTRAAAAHGPYYTDNYIDVYMFFIVLADIMMTDPIRTLYQLCYVWGTRAEKRYLDLTLFDVQTVDELVVLEPCLLFNG